MDNIYNFLMCIIFDEEIYCLIFELCKFIDQERETHFQEQLVKFKNYEPK